MEAKEAIVAEQAEAIAKAGDDMKEKMEELRKMQKDKANMQRKAQLEELGLETEAIESTLANFENAEEEVFDKVLTALAAVPRPKAEEDKKEEEAIEKPKAKEKEAKAEEELDSAEAGEEALEQVEPVEEVAIAELDEQEDPAESLRSVASEWLGSVLQTLPKQK